MSKVYLIIIFLVGVFSCLMSIYENVDCSDLLNAVKNEISSLSPVVCYKNGSYSELVLFVKVYKTGIIVSRSHKDYECISDTKIYKYQGLLKNRFMNNDVILTNDLCEFIVNSIIEYGLKEINEVILDLFLYEEYWDNLKGHKNNFHRMNNLSNQMSKNFKESDLNVKLSSIFSIVESYYHRKNLIRLSDNIVPFYINIVDGSVLYYHIDVCKLLCRLTKTDSFMSVDNKQIKHDLKEVIKNKRDYLKVLDMVIYKVPKEFISGTELYFRLLKTFDKNIINYFLETERKHFLRSIQEFHKQNITQKELDESFDFFYRSLSKNQEDITVREFYYCLFKELFLNDQLYGETREIVQTTKFKNILMLYSFDLYKLQLWNFKVKILKLNDFLFETGSILEKSSATTWDIENNNNVNVIDFEKVNKITDVFNKLF